MAKRSHLLGFLLPFAILATSAPASASPPQLERKLAALSDAGNGEAAYHLGMLYHLGLAGVGKDQRKAFTLFKQSTERGDPLGAFKLGCFYDGQGEGVVESDSTLALKYKMIAAEAGYELAQEDVARHLFAQDDIAGGLRWLEAAAAQGSAMPALALGGFYSGQMPKGFPSQPANAVKSWTYFLIAARGMPEMREPFEKDAREKLSKDEYYRVMANVSAWRPARTALTQMADGGVSEAYILAGLPVPAN